ncbi:hypothetical protein ACUXK4_002822 [Methylorubrum extorquens]
MVKVLMPTARFRLIEQDEEAQVKRNAGTECFPNGTVCISLIMVNISLT